tara:strand:+ start:221 stop:484 length:264 start_codon:yes stop_codon:yes gene_type:complete
MNHIETKFISATDTRGERIKATTTADRKTWIIKPYNYKLDVEENHRAVARELFDKLGWKKEDSKAYIRATNRGYIYTFHYNWNVVDF